MNLWRRLRRESQSADQSWARLQLLGAIERGGNAVTPTMLGKSESMRSSNLAAMLRDLEMEGLVVRTPDSEDRRKVRVRLTPRGHEVLHENITRREQWLAEAVEQSLTKEERALLFKAGELLDRISSYSGRLIPENSELRDRLHGGVGERRLHDGRRP